MSSPPLASVDDLEAWLGRAVDNEDRAEAVLVGASALVRGYIGVTYLDDDGNLEDDVPDNVRTVVLMVAERVLVTPSGIESESVSGYTVRFATGSSTGLLLTDTEKLMLTGQAGGLTSIRLEAPAFPLPRGWVEDDELIEGDDV